MYSTGLIIQARTTSTRLPGKVILPFDNQRSILEILIDRLKNHFNKEKIIVATTTNPEDDTIVGLCKKTNTAYYRGDENNVLQRFIEAAEKFDIRNIVRINADNPFLLPGYIQNLIDRFNEVDYLSYCFDDGTPVIKSHIGLFAEMTRLETLKKVARLTGEPLYREHVTNYIYSHPQKFKINLLPLPGLIKNRKDIRLTVDTKRDFEMAREIYKKTGEKNLDIEHLITLIDNNSDWKTIMLKEIKNNAK